MDDQKRQILETFLDENDVNHDSIGVRMLRQAIHGQSISAIRFVASVFLDAKIVHLSDEQVEMIRDFQKHFNSPTMTDFDPDSPGMIRPGLKP